MHVHSLGAVQLVYLDPGWSNIQKPSGGYTNLRTQPVGDGVGSLHDLGWVTLNSEIKVLYLNWERGEYTHAAVVLHYPWCAWCKLTQVSVEHIP